MTSVFTSTAKASLLVALFGGFQKASTLLSRMQIATSLMIFRLSMPSALEIPLWLPKDEVVARWQSMYFATTALLDLLSTKMLVITPSLKFESKM